MTKRRLMYITHMYRERISISFNLSLDVIQKLLFDLCPRSWNIYILKMLQTRPSIFFSLIFFLFFTTRALSDFSQLFFWIFRSCLYKRLPCMNWFVGRFAKYLFRSLLTWLKALKFLQQRLSVQKMAPTTLTTLITSLN